MSARRFGCLAMKVNAVLVARLAAVMTLAGIVPGSRAAESAHDRPDRPAAQKTEVVDLGGGVKMEFVLIPSGSFLMGSLPEVAGDADETPRHRVTLTQSFLLGKCEVTQEQWSQLMGSNPS